MNSYVKQKQHINKTTEVERYGFSDVIDRWERTWGWRTSLSQVLLGAETHQVEISLTNTLVTTSILPFHFLEEKKKKKDSTIFQVSDLMAARKAAKEGCFSAMRRCRAPSSYPQLSVSGDRRGQQESQSKQDLRVWQHMLPASGCLEKPTSNYVPKNHIIKSHPT